MLQHLADAVKKLFEAKCCENTILSPKSLLSKKKNILKCEVQEKILNSEPLLYVSELLIVRFHEFPILNFEFLPIFNCYL